MTRSYVLQQASKLSAVQVTFHVTAMWMLDFVLFSNTHKRKHATLRACNSVIGSLLFPRISRSSVARIPGLGRSVKCWEKNEKLVPDIYAWPSVGRPAKKAINLTRGFGPPCYNLYPQAPPRWRMRPKFYFSSIAGIVFITLNPENFIFLNIFTCVFFFFCSTPFSAWYQGWSYVFPSLVFVYKQNFQLELAANFVIASFDRLLWL